MPIIPCRAYKILYKIPHFIKKSLMVKKVFPEYSIIKASVDANYRMSYYKKFIKVDERKIYEKTLNLGYIIAEGPLTMYAETVLERQYDKRGFRPPFGSLVIDVGGAYGDTAIWYSKEFGAKVIVFEPLKERYDAIVKNVAANGVADKVTAYNVALGNGTKLKGQIWAGMFSILEGNTIFETKKLDDYGFTDVYLLKVDVEGFECEVLRGAINTINSSHPKIVIETHSSKLKKECIKLLHGLGYELKYTGKTLRCTNQEFDLVQVLFFDHK